MDREQEEVISKQYLVSSYKLQVKSYKLKEQEKEPRRHKDTKLVKSYKLQLRVKRIKLIQMDRITGDSRKRSEVRGQKS